MDLLRIEEVGIGGPALSLAVRRGERIVLLGPAGSGKTRLLLTLAGFVAVAGGALRLEGRDITRSPPEARDLAWIPAAPCLLPHRSVADNLAFGPRMRGLPRAARTARLAAALAASGLEDVADLRPAQLSQLQQERATLARALAAEPLAVLLDRPDVPLDRLVLPPRGRNPALLLATRRAGVALAVADRIALLRDRALVQLAPPAEMYARPADAYAATALGRCNLLAARREADGRVLIDDSLAPALLRAELAAGPCLLAVRPHRLRPDPDGALRGTVAEVAFQGSHTRVMLRRADGATVRADFSTPPADIAVGAPLRLGWDAADGWPVAA